VLLEITRQRFDELQNHLQVPDTELAVADVARYLRDQVETTAFCLFSMAEGIVHRHVFQGHQTVSRDEVIETGTRLLSAYFEQQSEG